MVVDWWLAGVWLKTRMVVLQHCNLQVCYSLCP